MATGSLSDLPISAAGDGGGDAEEARGSSSAAYGDVDVGSLSRSACGPSRPSAPSQQRAVKAARATVVPVPDVDRGECVVLDVRPVARHASGEGGESSESQCRICHLGSDLETPEGSELVPLGCDCKGELGMAHRHCAEYWFKVKGDRFCEICGADAKNVVGVNLSCEWNTNGVPNFSRLLHTPETETCCCEIHPFYKLLMVCLIVAFAMSVIVRSIH